MAIPLEPSCFVGDIWERDIRFIWEDLIDGASLFVSVVQPDPPHLAFRGTVATVIVHQHQLPDRALCNINVHTYIVLFMLYIYFYLQSLPELWITRCQVFCGPWPSAWRMRRHMWVKCVVGMKEQDWDEWPVDFLVAVMGIQRGILYYVFIYNEVRIWLHLLGEKDDLMSICPIGGCRCSNPPTSLHSHGYRWTLIS